MIEQGICCSFKQEVLQGVHSVSDSYMIALFGEISDLSIFTKKYSSKGEVSAEGYKAGGKQLQHFRVELKDESAVVLCDSPTWKETSISAKGALVYNASKNNRAVCVIDFGKMVTSTNSTFDVKIGELLSFD